MKRSIFAAFLTAVILMVCRDVSAAEVEKASYFGIDGKLVRSNASTDGFKHNPHHYSIRPHLGFKITNEISIETSHELHLASLGKMSNVDDVSAKANSSLLVVSFEKPFEGMPTFKWFTAAGVSHTKIKMSEFSAGNKVGSRKATRLAPAVIVGLKQYLGSGISARAFADWRGTNNTKVKQHSDPNSMHTFKHTFGVGLGLSKEF